VSGSDAEERVRAVAVAALRLEMPTARIIHELDVGGARLDLAAIETDRIVLVEIKSERDVLTRLAGQLRFALSVTDDVRVVCTPRHQAKITAARVPYIHEGPDRGANALHIKGLQHCSLHVESPAGLVKAWANHPLYNKNWNRERIRAEHVMDLMLQSEAKEALRPLGAKSRWIQREVTAFAMEHLSGAQIRRMTCAALRARHFARADAPIQAERIAA
jgi:hypothetical protein